MPIEYIKKEMIKIRAEVNEVENKDVIQKTKKAESLLFEKINDRHKWTNLCQ